MRKKFLYAILLLVLLVSALAVWKLYQARLQIHLIEKEEANQEADHAHKAATEHEHGQEEENVVLMSQEQIQNLGIQTQLAGPGRLSMLLATRGKIILHPDRLVHVLPKISGVAKEAKKNVGDATQEGELLAVLESREIADTKANYLAAKEKLFLAGSILEREKQLYEKRVSAQQDYINAKSAYSEARINVQLAQQKLRAFGMSDAEVERLSHADDPDLRLYEIRSPIQGMVIARHITKGEFIENTMTIYEIADFSTLWIEIGIYPKDLVKVKTGQLVDVVLSDGTTTQAKIIYLSPIIQDETITAKAIAELKHPSENWRPGSFVRVNIATNQATVPILISKEAIQEIDGKPSLFVKTQKGFEKRSVQLGLSNDTEVEVLSGLQPGEEYAASKTFLLKADLSKAEAEHEHG